MYTAQTAKITVTDNVLKLNCEKTTSTTTTTTSTTAAAAAAAAAAATPSKTVQCDIVLGTKYEYGNAKKV